MFFLEFIILLAPQWLFLLAFRYLKKKKKYFFYFNFVHNFVHAVQWQSLLDIIYSISNYACSICGLLAGGYFVNVDFVVLGHPSNKRKGGPHPFWWNKYCNKFSTSLCHLSSESVTYDLFVLEIYLYIITNDMLV